MIKQDIRMNEREVSVDRSRFDPPHEGMLPGESIVWSRRAGTGFWVVFFGALLVMGGPVLSFASLDDFGVSVGVFFGGLTIIGFIILIAILINVRRTRYYLTTDRVKSTNT